VPASKLSGTKTIMKLSIIFGSHNVDADRLLPANLLKRGNNMTIDRTEHSNEIPKSRMVSEKNLINN